MPQSDPSVPLEQTLPRSDSVLDPSAAPGSPPADGATLARPPAPTQAPPPRPESRDTNGRAAEAPVGDETLARPAVPPAPATWSTPPGLSPSSIDPATIDPAVLGETLQPPPSQFPSASAPRSGLSAMPTRLDPVYGPPVAAPAGPVPGYEVLGVLGQGGMGIVYKARHLALDRLVALKMILRGALADREAVERFRIEAQAVARLRHPNIVQIFEVGEHAGQPFFSLEYLEGGSLQQKLEGTPQAPRDAARMLELLARAIHHAHEQRVVHRDLKPANVLLAADGSPKITDFGLAKRIEDQDQNQTGAGAVLGTPTYMAPEQASGQTREVGPPADIYSLGAILYDLLTGRPPLRGTTLVDTLQMVRTTEPVPPRRLQPKVPPDLQNICLKCLEKEPRRRYASAEALADDLHRFLDGRPTAARPVSAPERAWKWAKRRPAEALLLLAGVVGVIGLVAALIVFAAQQGQLADAAAKREKLARDAETAEKAHSKELEEKQQEILKSQKETVAQRDRARQNLTQARQAVEELLEVAQKRLPNEPHLEGLRERILVFARQLSQNLLEQQSDDPEVRLQAARTTRLVGDIQETLNKLDEAGASYRSAADQYELLLRQPGAPPEWVREAAEDYQNLWVVQAAAVDYSAAGKALGRAEELLKSLADADARRDLAGCLNNRGIQLLLTGDAAGCERSLLEARDLLGKLPEDERKRPATRLELAKTEKNLGVLYRQTGRYPESEEQYRQALAALKELVLAEPDVPAYQKELGPAYINLAGLLADEGKDRFADAQAVYDDAVGLCEGLGDKFSGVADYRHLLALACTGRGELSRRRGDVDKARADVQRATELLGQLRNRTSYRVDEARAYNILGRIEAQAARPDDARKAWEHALAVCEALPDEDRRGPEAGGEIYRTCTALVGWYEPRVLQATRAQKWAAAAADMRTMIDLRRKRLDAFAASPEAQADETLRPAVGPLAASLVPGLLRDRQIAELASMRLALARVLGQARKYAEAGDALDALTGDKADLPRRWAKLPEAAAFASRLAGQTAADKELSTEEAGRLSRAFTGRALALLSRAADEGVTAPAKLLDSSDFDSLRDSPEFKALRDRLTTSNGARP